MLAKLPGDDNHEKALAGPTLGTDKPDYVPGDIIHLRAFSSPVQPQKTVRELVIGHIPGCSHQAHHLLRR